MIAMRAWKSLEGLVNWGDLLVLVGVGAILIDESGWMVRLKVLLEYPVVLIEIN